MKPVINEFSRPLAVDRVPANGCYERIVAEPSECEAVAKRIGVTLIHTLSALVKADPWRKGIKMTGTLDVDLERESVVSLEQFRQSLRYEFTRYFMPSSATVPEEAEDIDLIENGQIDMGEIVVETLALELDPYPRKPGEQFKAVDAAAEPKPASPFAALSRLKPDAN